LIEFDLFTEDGMREMFIEELIWYEDVLRWLLSIRHSIPYPLSDFTIAIRNVEENDLYMEWSSVYSAILHYEPGERIYTTID
jgi:hypothetical protein